MDGWYQWYSTNDTGSSVIELLHWKLLPEFFLSFIYVFRLCSFFIPTFLWTKSFHLQVVLFLSQHLPSSPEIRCWWHQPNIYCDEHSNYKKCIFPEDLPALWTCTRLFSSGITSCCQTHASSVLSGESPLQSLWCPLLPTTTGPVMSTFFIMYIACSHCAFLLFPGFNCYPQLSQIDTILSSNFCK